jgi:hypothetical protein
MDAGIPRGRLKVVTTRGLPSQHDANGLLWIVQAVVHDQMLFTMCLHVEDKRGPCGPVQCAHTRSKRADETSRSACSTQSARCRVFNSRHPALGINAHIWLRRVVYVPSSRSFKLGLQAPLATKLQRVPAGACRCSAWRTYVHGAEFQRTNNRTGMGSILPLYDADAHGPIPLSTGTAENHAA